VDPPRAGLHPDARNRLLELTPPRLVYISCNPATLARDVQEFVTGGYRLEVVRPIDLFPHTAHVESVALLTRR
jgi:23S rRNA (uracil1939-C5)-methyltransferase